MAISQREKQTPAHDPSLLTDLSTHIFSMDYLCFAPAILASLLWHLLPIPKVGTMCLFLWSLPLFTAGAVTALNKGPHSLFSLIYSRCPIQGIFILVYAFIAFAGFFFVLLSVNSLGWIGSAWGEILMILLMGAGIVMPMVRIWPDYLLRVIHPRYGLGDSWIGADFPRGLGPTFLTAWKYSARAKLPVSTIASALISLFVVASGVVFLYADLFPDHKNLRFTGGIFLLGFFYPVAHLVLVRAGFKLLFANCIYPEALEKKDSRPLVSSLPGSETRYQKKIFDKDLPIDKRVFGCVNMDEVQLITGWLEQKYNKKYNVVAFYNQKRKRIEIIEGPWQTGHWGHETYGQYVPVEDALIGIYPQGFSLENKYVEIIKQYILENDIK